MQTMQPTESLRDRKRRQARAATQRVAIELCLEHGVDAVSVDTICEHAGISPRTFYNYFGSRESAVLGGDEKPLPTEAQIQDFIDRDDVSDVEAFAAMMSRVWVEAEPDRELFLLRRRLLESSPELSAANWSRITEARAQYAVIVRRRLAARAPGATDEQLDTDAELVVALAMGTVQVVAREWLADHTDADLVALLHDYFPRVRRLTQAAPASVPTA